MTIRPAQPEDYENALRWLSPRDEAGALQVHHRLECLKDGTLDARGLWVAVEAGTIQGALLYQTGADGAALVWPAGATDPANVAALHTHVQAQWKNTGIPYAFALVEPDTDAGGLTQAGFQSVTHVLEMTLSIAPRVDLPEDDLIWSPYHSVAPEAFTETFRAGFIDSLDCPELNPLRSAEVVQEGYALTAPDTRLWWLIEEAWPVRRALATVVVARSGEREWELAFLGVIPDARRRGVGRRLLFTLLGWASLAGVRTLRVTVDERNLPALQIYMSAGFLKQRSYQLFLMHQL
jgi:mycothiol synthase